MKSTLVLKDSKSVFKQVFGLGFLSTTFSVLLILISSNAFGEGTKEVMPTSTNGVGLYLSNNNSSGPFFNGPSNQRIVFNISDHTTENFYFGGQFYDRTPVTQRSDVYIKIRNSVGTVVYGPQLYPTAGAGYISTYAEAVAGPNIAGSAPTGYTPLMFNPTANDDYQIEIYASADGGFNTST